jgi:hypothetical protein
LTNILLDKLSPITITLVLGLINKLLDRLNASDGGKYHHIDLQEIEIRQPRGYFDYLFENEQVFADAYEDAMRCFDKLGYKAAPEVQAEQASVTGDAPTG